MNIISVLNDFTEFPGLRNCSISANSGEEFYHELLNRAFKEAYEQGEILCVDLDYTDGYASSFLDEAFGNLVYDYTLNNVKRLIKIISIQESHWIEMIQIETYLQWEKRRLNRERPKVTKIHEPWYRLMENELILKVWEMPIQKNNAENY